MDKLEEMQWSVVWQEDASEAEWEGLQHCGPALLYDAETWATTREQYCTTRSKWDEDAEIDVRSDKEG